MLMPPPGPGELVPECDRGGAGGGDELDRGDELEHRKDHAKQGWSGCGNCGARARAQGAIYLRASYDSHNYPPKKREIEPLMTSARSTRFLLLKLLLLS